MPLITDSIGRVLGKRYRLVVPLGSGASAHVFLAEDVSLRRRVAVKVLQPGLAHDQSFLRRFRAEAQAAAALNHPHVLRVFDWGEDEHDGPYLVLEYLGGGSLREVLDRGCRLSHSQAAQVGAQVARGLAYAHARGLVHRDVKPANLLFDEEGRVRVTDFGVARALAEAAWTEPVGAMVGTARYASPEQAEGRAVDGRSDMYSLALVLYESLTGEVPFTKDTTVATLTARLGASLPHHEALGPLEDVIFCATTPGASERLDAAGLAIRLEELSTTLPPPAPLPLRISDTDSSSRRASNGFRLDLDELGHTAVGPPASGEAALEPTTVGASASSQTAVGSPIPRHVSLEEAAFGHVDLDQPPVLTAVGRRPGPTDPYDFEAFERAEPGARKPGGRPRSAASRRTERKEHPWRPLLVGLVVLAVLVAVGLVVASKEQAFTPSHRVPALAGISLTQARQTISPYHFVLEIGAAVPSTTVGRGDVVSQNPAPGTDIKEGSIVRVVPSSGPPPVQVPSLSGLDCATAERLLAEAHLKAACPQVQAYSQTVPEGQVMNWSYGSTLNPTSAPYGSTILIAISEGPPPVAVPSVTAAGTTWAQAESVIQGAGLHASENLESSVTVPAGHVIDTKPAAGTPLTPGSIVTVDVSSGAPKQVPDVQGDSVAKASAVLKHAGFTVGQVSGPQNGTVSASVPPANQTAPEHSVVNLDTEAPGNQPPPGHLSPHGHQ